MISSVTFMNPNEMSVLPNFCRNDLKSIMNKAGMNNQIVEITNILIAEDDRNKGNGSQELQNFCAVNKNSVIITGGCLMEQLGIINGIINSKENEQNKERVYKFFEKNGFVSVNKYIGKYKHSNVLIYKNELGKKIIKHCEEAYMDFKEEQDVNTVFSGIGSK